MKKHGFTVVEILIVITIMGILLILAVINVNSSQVQARDNERKVDVENIALALETGFKDPNTMNQDFTQTGYYPGTAVMGAAINANNVRALFPDLDPESLRAPNVDEDDPVSLVLATNGTQTTAGVRPLPTISTYVYQPISTSGLCADKCRSFNLYYRQEADNTVQVVKSRRQ